MSVLGVLQSMQIALRAINGSGYNYTVKPASVVLDPVNLEGVPATEVPFFVLDHQQGDMQYTTSRPTAIKVDFLVDIYVRLDVANNLDNSRKRTAAWLMYNDVERALCVDLQRGGNAMFTYIHWPEFYFGLATQSMVFIKVPVRILLQRTYGVP